MAIILDGDIGVTAADVAATTLSINAGYGSNAAAYGVRAWVNFDGTGTVAIRESGNVSSITDNGTGNYTINFATALVDSSYTVCGSTMRGVTNTDNNLFLPLNGTYTTAACQVMAAASSSSGLLLDCVIVNVNIFR